MSLSWSRLLPLPLPPSRPSVRRRCSNTQPSCFNIRWPRPHLFYPLLHLLCYKSLFDQTCNARSRNLSLRYRLRRSEVGPVDSLVVGRWEPSCVAVSLFYPLFLSLISLILNDP